MKRSKTYKNGLRLVVESNNSNNVAFQVLYGVGSINEKPSEYGFAHFLEHIMFKSTHKRTTTQIAEDNDYLGTTMNASTTYSHTKYYFISIKENFEKSLEVFSDMLINNVWNEEEIEVEKNVVIEEIKMYNDQTETQLDIEVGNAYRNKTPFNHGIIGKAEVIKNAKIKNIVAFKEKFYIPSNTIISVSGGVSFWKAKRLIKKYFPDWLIGNDTPKTRIGFKADNQINKHFLVCDKDEQQVKVCILIKGVPYSNNAYYKQTLLTKILSSGLSSRFYVNLVEKRGLAYYVLAHTYLFSDAGEFEITFGTSNEKLKLAMQEIRKTLEDIVSNGITDFELQKVKNKTKANIAINKRTNNFDRATYNAEDLFYDRKTRKIKLLLSIVNSITKEDIQNFAKQILEEENFVVGAIGKNVNINDLKVFKEIKKNKKEKINK